MGYIHNPKTAGSGILGCCPQTGYCPHDCPDCYFNSGRSYLEPIAEHLPNMPPLKLAKGHVVRVNDVGDSNVEREKAIAVWALYDDAFFNTSIPEDIEKFPGPVVLTVNPGACEAFSKVSHSSNLMFVRALVNTWNIRTIDDIVDYYTDSFEFREVPVVLTFMRYYKVPVPVEQSKKYIFKKSTLNTYWCITNEAREAIEDRYRRNPWVYTCTHNVSTDCSRCGNCLREYYATKLRMEGKS